MIVSAQANPRRTAIVWDMSKYTLIDCDAAGSNTIIKLEEVGTILRMNCPHFGRAQGGFSAILSDVMGKLMGDGPFILERGMNLDIFEDTKQNYKEQVHRIGHLRRGRGGS